MKRIVALTLAALLLIATLAACGTQTPSETDTTSAPADTTVPTPDTTEPAETEYPAPVIENTNYAGQTIRVLSIGADTTRFPYSEVLYDEGAGDIINDALFRRNARITEKYGVTIKTVETTTGSGLNAFINAVNANNNDIHIATISIAKLMSAAQQGYLADISTLPYIEPDAPWYSQNLRKSLSIGGEDYLLISNFNMRSYDTISFIGYNKKMVETFGIEDLNQLALDGKWTLDKMYELCTLVGNDLNNDGVTNEEDQIGVRSNCGTILYFFTGAGGRFIEKDSNDIPTYVGLSAKNEQLLSKITDFLYDEPASWHGSADAVKVTVNPFNVNKQLFSTSAIYSMRGFADSGVDYGILPYPKADESQEDYYCMLHNSLGTAVGIPINNTKMEMTCAVVADMMYLSYKIIYPAHIEKAMQMRYSPDEESTEMLEMLFDSLSIEMSTALNLKCDTQLRAMGTDHLKNFASAFESIKSGDETLLANYVKAFTEKQ